MYRYGPWSRYEAIVERAVGVVRPTRPQVLHLGSGTAELGLVCCAGGCVTDVDINALDLAACRDRAPPGRRQAWVRGDVRRLAFRDGCFDLVLDKGCYDELCSWGGQPRHQAVLTEIHRVLRPAGALVIVSSSDRYDALTTAALWAEVVRVLGHGGETEPSVHICRR